MPINPYESPTTTVDHKPTHVLFRACMWALVTYVAVLLAALLFGSGISLLRRQSLADWWYDHAYLMLIAPPLVFSLSAFIHHATERKCRAEIAFLSLAMADIFCFAITTVLGYGSPRYLRGLDPLIYPVEIWAHVVPYAVVTVAVVSWFRLSAKGRSQPAERE